MKLSASTSPKISIGMPVYNSNPGFFGQALESLLAQDFADFEIILSDNASSPEATAMYERASARDPRIRYFRQSRTVSAAENFRFVLSQARGAYFMWAADDDIRAPSFVGRASAALDAQSQARIASSRMVYIDRQGARVGAPVFHPDSGQASVSRRVRALTSAEFYMDIYGLFRLDFLRGLDVPWDAWGFDGQVVFEALLRGPIVRIDEELFFYRVRPQADSLAAYVVREKVQAGDPRLNWESDRSKALLGGLLRTKLPYREKAIALARLLVILRRSPFVDERRRLARFRYAEALRQDAYIRAARFAVTYALLSPLAPFRRSAWKGAVDRGREKP
jgi:glycosyltransferase involved in cell wall biosynthesis